MKWYQQTCVNKRDYLLENLEKFHISHSELILLLMIDYLNQQGILITHDSLSAKLNISKQEVDQLLNELINKNYLYITISNGSMVYCFDGIFEMKNNENEFDKNLFEIFEQEFKRMLSQKELERLNEWALKYEKDLIVYALIEAVAYEKLSFDYIGRILLNWSEKGYTAKDYVEGKRV